jgi:hypothetical protein
VLKAVIANRDVEIFTDDATVEMVGNELDRG